ncbi:hypothetical protein [Inhella proteolytica]|uniref:Uncharacterized protein n=1 Tax=Inhella proteolytica TaxID=2795029 RepID=A0A931NHJ9_9BURK|nr:hypothetical protein [Inhella proteolytica]MBH9578311.1 hypothetical protein [Inhella proteolytica]
MNWMLAWADSELAGIERQGADLHLRLSAARLRQGEQARYARGLVLVLEQAEPEGDAAALAGLFGALEAGELQVGGQRQRSVALGQRVAGPVRLVLQLRRGREWCVQAQALCLPPAQGLTLHEDWAC